MAPLIDTHCHLYLPDFEADREAVMERARQAGISKIVLPNIDAGSIDALRGMCRQYPLMCLPLMGLHPCSVNEHWRKELSIIQQQLEAGDLRWYGIGETGLDYYWSRQYVAEQKQNLEQHIQWSISYRLPLILHSRNALDDCIELISRHRHPQLRGIFHCFSGTLEQARRIVAEGFLLGIGGVVTFPNSKLNEVLPHIGLEHLVLETDSPYLAPVPFRGRRNESSYLTYVVACMADMFQTDADYVARQTSANAARLFGISL